MAAASPPPSPPAAKRPRMSSSSDPEADAEPTAPGAGADPGQRRPRYKRRKVAILLGYCGAGYQGMQKNPGARTIEGDLEEALYQAGAVPEADRAAPRRYDWARAARTDKGVSAAAQVVSGRFYVDPPGFIDRLNAQLAPQIRAYGYVRVTNSFSAKKFCDRRRYLYLLPVFALDPSAHPDREAVMASMGSGSELTKCLECSERGRKVPGVMGREGKLPSPVENGVDAPVDGAVDSHEESGSIGDAKCDPAISDGGDTNALGEVGLSSNEKLDLPVPADGTQAENADLGSNGVGDVVPSDTSIGNEENKLEAPATEEKVQGMDLEKSNGEEKPPTNSSFSYTDEVKERFNRILKYYVGTHNFHNFTTRTKAEDPAAKRFIISFAADRVVSLDGIDFVRCEVVGQSFMLHQIRKMIGLAVAVMRNCAPESIYDVAFRKDVNLNVPTAPEVGLYLDECMFTSYNKKWKDSHESVSMEPYCEEAEEFKVKYIFPHIAAMEHKEGAVALWLHSLNHRNYPDFRYMETAGAEAKVGDGVGRIAAGAEAKAGDEVGSIAAGAEAKAGDGVGSIAAGAEAKAGDEVDSIEEVQMPSYNIQDWIKKHCKDTGLGRTEDGGIEALDQQWWKDNRKGKFSECKKFGMPTYIDQLHEMFDGTTVDGSTSCIPGTDGDQGTHNLDEVGDEEEEEEETFRSPLSTDSRKRGSSTTDAATSSRKKITSPMVKCINKLIHTMEVGSIKDELVAREIQLHINNLKAEQIQEEQRRNEEITKTMKMVRACGLTEDTEEFYVASRLFMDDYNRRVFNHLTTDAERIAWLKRCIRDWNK